MSNFTKATVRHR